MGKDDFSGMCRIGLMLALVQFILIFSSGSASGIGFSPAQKTIPFASGEAVTLSLNIVNGEGIEDDVVLSSFGELKDSVFFSNSTVHLLPQNYMAPFTLVFRMPNEMQPGIHEVGIRATPKIAESGETFRAFVSPAIYIRVRVPYPSKYADVSIAVLPVDEGTPVPINIEFDNLGNQDIASAGGTIEVFAPSGESVEKLTASRISIPANTFGKTEGSPIAALPKGEYVAVAEAYYDSSRISLSQNFTLGEPDVSIISVSSKPLKPRQVNPVSFIAKLDWNRPLAVKGFLSIDGVEREMPLATLSPLKENEMTGFADASSLDVGEHELIVKLVYGSSVKSAKFRVRIVEPPLPGILTGGEGGSAPLIILVFVVVAIVLAAVFVLVRRRKKKGRGPGFEGETFK
jgi:hypothetical protein